MVKYARLCSQVNNRRISLRTNSATVIERDVLALLNEAKAWAYSVTGMEPTLDSATFDFSTVESVNLELSLLFDEFVLAICDLDQIGSPPSLHPHHNSTISTAALRTARCSSIERIISTTNKIGLTVKL